MDEERTAAKETYQPRERVSCKGHRIRRLIQDYAISNDDPVTDAREFFDPKTKDLHLRD